MQMKRRADRSQIDGAALAFSPYHGADRRGDIPTGPQLTAAPMYASAPITTPML